jgi:hypothetical protein
MSLPTGHKLFAERVDFTLVEAAILYSGPAALVNPQFAQHLHAYYAVYEDVSNTTLRELERLRGRSGWVQPSIREKLVPLFWTEFADNIRLLPVKARLTFGLPRYVAPEAAWAFDEQDIKMLELAPFKIEGEQRGVFDDVCFFDVPATMVQPDGTIDLEPIERFMSLGTSVSFFFPGPHHQRWYTFAKGHQLPPALRCNRRLNVVFNGPLSADVTSIVFGVDKSGQPSESLTGPIESTPRSTT